MTEIDFFQNHQGKKAEPMEQTKTYQRVLTIAGSDSGGGAGIQADLKTIAANGCYGMSVITALTAQNTVGVTGIHAVPVEFVAAQMEAVLSDIGADAVKIGMLFSPELIRTVAETLRTYNVRTIILDPVMIAQSGDKLLQDEAIDALKKHLIPLACLITPNLPEASVLLGREIGTTGAIESAAVELAAMGCENVLIKGGHLESDASDDCLYLGPEQRMVILPGERIATRNNHGTGCTLSSAIASFIARGETIENAVHHAKEYITGAIRAGAAYTIGHGHGPVHHFYRFF
jgi:hydroxymethylpyrimidine/phosphomethylpyrimidine kinase